MHCKCLQVFILFASLFSSEIKAQSKGSFKPNIIFIISDDHRWDALGAAGNTKIHTPNLDRLAKEGSYFSQATIHVSQCTPSRSALLTGLPPHQNGVYSIMEQSAEMEWAKQFQTTTFVEYLQQAGYETFLSGKWHVPPDPWNSGFNDLKTWLPEGVAP